MSPNPHCPACEVKRLHTEIETGGFHPLAGHGFYQGLGWSRRGQGRARRGDCRARAKGRIQMSDLHPSPVARLLAKPAVYGAVAMLWLPATVVIFWTSIPGLSRIQQAR